MKIFDKYFRPIYIEHEETFGLIQISIVACFFFSPNLLNFWIVDAKILMIYNFVVIWLLFSVIAHCKFTNNYECKKLINAHDKKKP